MPTCPRTVVILSTLLGICARLAPAQSTDPTDTQAASRSAIEQSDRTESGDLPKNIIIFIADGAGISTHAMTDAWTGTPPVYRSDDWLAFSDATWCLRASPSPKADTDPLAQDPNLVYDPDKAWDTTPVEGSYAGFPYYFAGYRYLRATAPDSAATISALMTGTPTFLGALDVDGAGNPTQSVAEAAHKQGKRVGVITTVPFDHATPAGAAGVHVANRSAYRFIAHEMLTSGILDCIGGAGHPFYNNNGSKLPRPNWTYIRPKDFRALKAGKPIPELSLREQSQNPVKHLDEPTGDTPAWTLVEDTRDIQKLASGDTPDKLIMIAKAGQTLQAYRKPRSDKTTAHPGTDPLNSGLPTMTDLTLAALNALDDDPDGFFLMAEGGAVDWAMHDDDAARMIEEMIDFNNAVAKVCEQLDAGDHSYTWDNTLVIVTADHDHLLLGPHSDTIPFEPIKDNGPGVMPGYRWHNNAHSNTPVPFFVRGPGSERFAALPTKPDTADTDTRHFARPPYFHETDVGRLLLNMLSHTDTTPGK